MGAAGKRKLLAFFGCVRLYYANTSERLAQPPRDLGCYLSAFAKDRAQHPERIQQSSAKNKQHDDSGNGELPIDVNQNADRDRGCDQAADDLSQTGTDEISN